MTNAAAHLNNIAEHKDNEKRPNHKIHIQRSFSGWTLRINTTAVHMGQKTAALLSIHLARAWADSEEGKG